MADGETAYKEYLPNEIKGYRLSETGACYVSRTFPVDGELVTFFAEYLLEGGVSLYRHKEGTVEYFYLVDADGKVAMIRETGDVILRRDDQITAQRQKLVEATQIFQKSQSTLKQLWAMPQVSAEQLLKLTKAYNQEFYAEAGETEFYQKDLKSSDGLIARLRFEAGVGISNMKFFPNSPQYNDPIETTSLIPVVGVGTDMILPRLSKNLLMQAMFYYSYNKGKPEDIKHYPYTREWTFHDLSLQVGAAYSFMPEKRISPYFSDAPHYLGMGEGFRLSAQIAAAQFEAIRNLAKEGNAVFVGRCADYVLRQREDLLRVFIMAPLEARIRTLMERRDLTADQARKLVKQVDKDRSGYYKYYTDQSWGDLNNYDLCVNSALTGVEGAVKAIVLVARGLEKAGTD